MPSEKHRISAANRFGWDYRLLAASLPPAPVPIIDAHTHITGPNAAPIYDEVRRRFGVTLTYSMTQLAQAAPVRDLLGPSIRFIAFPSFGDPDKNRSHRAGYIETIEKFRTDFDSRILKLWGSPRLRDFIPDVKEAAYGATDIVEIDSPWRIKACELGEKLGMMYMIHIADPDTWFATKYADSARYGTKRQQYEGFERMLDRFTNPWIAAHMGGWPEDLAFLDGLLTRHPNLHLDTSAMKWQVREISKHPKAEAVAFFTKWGLAGRLLFGTDIVVTEDHLQKQKTGPSPMGDLADSPESAWELYASRYWCLRTMLESNYDAESPVADPDLAMVDPATHTPMSAPHLRGLSLPQQVLKELYHDAAARLVEGWWVR